MRLPLVAAMMATSAGCTVGPDYSAPTPGLPERFAATETSGAIDTTWSGSVDARWWTSLGDPVLDTLVREAVAGNRDVAIAIARVRESRALVRVAGASDLPSVGSSASYERSRGSANGIIDLESIPGASLGNDLFQGGFDAAWEIDVFGGTRRAVERAVALYESSREDRRAITLVVVSEVATAYADLRGFERRLAVVRDNIRIQADTLDRVRANVETGFATTLDLAGAEAQLAQTRSLEPALAAQAELSRFRLAVLIGRTPGSLGELVPLQPDRSPSVPDVVRAGLPADLVRRRPDVRRSERALAAATADIGVNTAELYPRFSLTGAFALESTSFGDVVDIGSRAWRIGPSVRWRLFEGGRLRALVDAAEARQEAAWALYEQTVLLALEEVEAGLAMYASELDRRDRLRRSVQQTRLAFEAARSLYEDGLEDAFAVLQAERDLAERALLLAESEQAVLVTLVGVYKSLGGGWETFEEDLRRRERAEPLARLEARDTAAGD